MGITNTIAKLKSYFEEWHDNAHSYSDTTLSERIEDLENMFRNTWSRSFFDQISHLITNFNTFIGSEVNADGSVKTTLANIITRINDHNNSKSAHGIGTWQALEKYQVFDHHPGNSHAYINKSLGLILIRFWQASYKYNVNNKNKWIQSNIQVKQQYAPKGYRARFSVSPYTEGAIFTDGYVYFRSIYSSSVDIDVKGTTMYIYKR